MPINPAIAMGFQAPKFENPLNTLVQMEQIKAYQQNALAKQMEMEAARRELDQRKGLRNYLADMKSGESLSPADLAQFGETGLKYGKMIQEMESQQATKRKADTDAAMKIHEYYLTAVPGLKTPDEVFSWAKTYRSDPRLKPLTSGMSDEEAFARLPKTPEALERWKSNLLVPFKDQQQHGTDRLKNLDAEINSLVGKLNAYTPEGVLTTDPAVAQQLAVLQARRAQLVGGMGAPAAGGQPMPPDLTGAIEGMQPSVVPPPVAPDSVPGLRTLQQLPTDQAVPTTLPSRPGDQGKMVPLAGAPKDVTTQVAEARANVAEKQKEVQYQAELRKNKPKVINQTKSAFASLDELTSSVDELLGTFKGKGSDPNNPASYTGHPGLSDVSGRFLGTEAGKEYFGRFQSDEAADAFAIQNRLDSGKFMGSIEQLKALSPTGSTGLGALAVREGEELKRAFADISSARNTETYKKKLIEFKAKLDRIRVRLAEGVNEEFGAGTIKVPGKGGGGGDDDDAGKDMDLLGTDRKVPIQPPTPAGSKVPLSSDEEMTPEEIEELEQLRKQFGRAP
jgi:hypothetical protein